MKLVLFDVDGTLLDSQHLIHAALSVTFGRMNRPVLERSVMLSIVGLSLEPAFQRLFGEEASAGDIAQASEHYRDAFRLLVADPAYSPPLFPGAAETVAALRQREDVVLGIATGKTLRGVERILELFDWQYGVFATIQTADSAPSKPHPAMVLQAAREVGVAPSDVLMIGDTSFDVAMGRSAGAVTVGVSWGNHPVAELQEAGADHIIDDFGQLMHLVETSKVREHS